jgi:hypothetical protein
MAKYNQFDSMFDECLESLLAGKQTVEQCLQKYPEQANELEPLLRTAMSVRQAVDIKPSPETKARGRYQLQLKMAEMNKPKRAWFPGWQPRWAMAVMAVLLVFVMGGGAVVAANGSMPGSPLYPVKIATENVRVKLAGSDVEKVELLTTLADRRVTELSYLMESGKPDVKKVEGIAARYNDHVTQVGTIAKVEETAEETMMIAATADSPAPEAAPTPSLAAVTTTAPETAPTPSLTAEPKIAGGQTKAPAPEITAGDQKASLRAGTAAEKETVSKEESQKEQLRKLIAYYGTQHPQELEKLLESDKVPEKVKPAIRRMLQEAKGLSKHATRDTGSRRKSDD